MVIRSDSRANLSARDWDYIASKGPGSYEIDGQMYRAVQVSRGTLELHALEDGEPAPRGRSRRDDDRYETRDDRYDDRDSDARGRDDRYDDRDYDARGREDRSEDRYGSRDDRYRDRDDAPRGRSRDSDYRGDGPRGRDDDDAPRRSSRKGDDGPQKGGIFGGLGNLPPKTKQTIHTASKVAAIGGGVITAAGVIGSVAINGFANHALGTFLAIGVPVGVAGGVGLYLTRDTEPKKPARDDDDR